MLQKLRTLGANERVLFGDFVMTELLFGRQIRMQRYETNFLFYTRMSFSS